jgi:nitroimidazol reductase NimA-like FMN-containing flavoprotein (pyridoxamine 5'-phosphate oxidase superfamily)
MTSNQTIEELDPAECWRLLATQTVGRVAVSDGSAAHIWPVNFRVRGEQILFRTDRGGKAVDISAHPDVAFEVDGFDSGLYWSVVVNGTAELRASDEPGIHDGRTELVTQNPGVKRYFVFIAGTVTGRRFASAVERSSIWSSASSRRAAPTQLV